MLDGRTTPPQIVYLDAPGDLPDTLVRLHLLVAGKSNKLICRELDVSEATVKTHLQAIFRKLDVNSRTQALHFARTNGWLGI